MCRRASGSTRGFLIAANVLAFAFLTSGCGPVASEPAEALARPHAYNRVVALTIGINHYASSSITALRYAERDAQSVADLLRSHYAYETKTLLGPKATRDAIRAWLD